MKIAAILEVYCADFGIWVFLTVSEIICVNSILELRAFIFER